MKVVAYSICRRCAAVYPEGRRCPACDGDAVAARAIADASAHAIEHLPVPAPRRQHRAVAMSVLAALVLALGATVAAIAAPALSSGHWSGSPEASVGSGSTGAGSTSGGAPEVRE